jgi:hypothetical protein
MYTLSSTAGLNITVPTIEQVGAVLAEHLHETAPERAVHWRITTPWGSIPNTGHLRLNGLPDDGFIADAVAEVVDDLTASEINRSKGSPPE